MIKINKAPTIIEMYTPSIPKNTPRQKDRKILINTPKKEDRAKEKLSLLKL